MKKLIIGVMALMLILTGCSSNAKPEDTVDTFFTAVKGFDLEKAAKTLSPEAIDELKEKFNEVSEYLIENGDGEDVEAIDYTSLEGFTESPAVIQGYLLGKLEYKVGEATITGDNKELATVVVNVSYIDAGEVFTNTFGEMFGRIIGMAFTGEEPSKTEILEIALKVFNEQAEAYEAAKVSKDITLNLTKIEDKWFIDELDEETINVLLFGIQDAFDSWGDGLFGNSDLDNDEDNSRAISIKAITNSGINNYTVFEENIHTVDELFKKLEEENWFSIQLDSTDKGLKLKSLDGEKEESGFQWFVETDLTYDGGEIFIDTMPFDESITVELKKLDK